MSFPLQKKTMALLAVLAPLFFLFVYVALRSGPLAPISVTLTTVENKSLTPALYGIGTVEARYTYKIGPTVAGRLKQLDVHVGDYVKAGQILGEMDPVDLDKRILAQDATLKRTSAQLREARARRDYAQTQAERYTQLWKVKSTSEEMMIAKQQELRIAEAALSASFEEIARVKAEREALVAQRKNLQLVTQVDGLVVRRDVDPGTTVVAGQSVIEIIDPDTLWINVRFDQIRTTGLTDNLPAQIRLRSQADITLKGHVLRIEPLADSVTEEILAKVVFKKLPEALPLIGELAEVTVNLPSLAPGPVIPNAAIKRKDGELGVWKFQSDQLQFTPVNIKTSNLDGQVLIHNSLKAGDQIVTYSEKVLSSHSRIHIVDQLPGISP